MSKNIGTKRLAIAKRLHLARELSGLSQGQVAKILGLKRPAVSEVEAGRRKVSAEELATLSEIYSVSIAWLAGVDDEKEDLARDKTWFEAREIAKLTPEDSERLLKLLLVYFGETQMTLMKRLEEIREEFCPSSIEDIQAAIDAGYNDLCGCSICVLIHDLLIADKQIEKNR